MERGTKLVNEPVHSLGRRHPTALGGKDPDGADRRLASASAAPLYRRPNDAPHTRAWASDPAAGHRVTPWPARPVLETMRGRILKLEPGLPLERQLRSSSRIRSQESGRRIPGLLSRQIPCGHASSPFTSSFTVLPGSSCGPSLGARCPALRACSSRHCCSHPASSLRGASHRKPSALSRKLGTSSASP